MKNIKNKIIIFDKEKEMFSFVLGDGNLYPFNKIKKARKSLDHVGSLTNKMFANMGRMGLGASSENVQVRIKVIFNDATFTYGYISKETCQNNSLKYHEDARLAEEIIIKLNRIAAKNRGEDTDFAFKLKKHLTNEEKDLIKNNKK